MKSHHGERQVKALLIVFTMLWGPCVFAETQTESPPPIAEKTAMEKAQEALDSTGRALKSVSERISDKLNETRIRRGDNNYFVLATYSPADLLIPGKKGLTAGLIKDAGETWEFEYLSGDAGFPWVLKDLGKMQDRRFSIIRRSYSERNSFNISYGITYTDFSIHLGNGIMSRVSGGRSPSMDLVEIETIGANVAIGNRWTFNKDITLGVDWISWAQPLHVLRKQHDFLSQADNQKDRDDVGKAASLIAYFPRVAVFKIQLGILF